MVGGGAWDLREDPPQVKLFLFLVELFSVDGQQLFYATAETVHFHFSGGSVSVPTKEDLMFGRYISVPGGNVLK